MLPPPTPFLEDCFTLGEDNAVPEILFDPKVKCSEPLTVFLFRAMDLGHMSG